VNSKAEYTAYIYKLQESCAIAKDNRAMRAI